MTNNFEQHIFFYKDLDDKHPSKDFIVAVCPDYDKNFSVMVTYPGMAKDIHFGITHMNEADTLLAKAEAKALALAEAEVAVSDDHVEGVDIDTMVDAELEEMDTDGNGRFTKKEVKAHIKKTMTKKKK